MRCLALLAVMAPLALADVYMHNPRGSNDRNCERNVNRNNGNRLFDSQNNAKGGYACPRPVGGPEVLEYVPSADRGAGFFDDTQLATQVAGANTSYYQKMYYLAGSKLPIEWTSQHGCGGNQKEHCDIVIQYACEDTLDPFFQFDAPHPVSGDRWIGTPRDGQPTDSQDAATNTIPDNLDAATADSEGDRRYGMHENYYYYQACKQRQRNKGLFTADQKLRRNDARATRQNPNGNRNGLECPEERDHYPYWHPTPWIDVAILHDKATTTGATNTAWCNFYKANSQNLNDASAGVCVPNDASPTETPQQVANRKNQGQWHNNQAACVAAGHTWDYYPLGIQKDDAKLTALRAAIQEVDCQPAAASRINHLGNADDSNYGDADDAWYMPHDNNAARYVWTVPQHYNENCVLRLRYNISTDDYPAWATEDTDSNAPAGTPGLNSTFNGKDDSPITQDPYIYLDNGNTEFVSLAVNTNQYSRTFQDRSYVFAIRKPPADMVAAGVLGTAANRPRIINLNVRGKRGNIVQTYPAVEYDFVPNNLNIKEEDFIHFQWTGSDYNPRRGCNNAEGGPPDPNNAAAANQNSRADRSNIVSMEAFADQYPNPTVFPQGEDTKTTPGDRPTLTSAAGTMFATTTEVMDMAFIKQDRFLQPAAPCLTEEQLEDINGNNNRENHPRNCAKLNAAFTPYFDGGAKKMTKEGTFAYFSSRNNNFSNRDQTGRLCVQGGAWTCGGPGGPVSPLVRVPAAPAANAPAEIIVLAEETFNFNERDNDSTGDGEKEDCEEFGSFLGNVDEGTAVGLIIAMMFVGAVITLAAQWALRWYLVKPRGIADICCGGDTSKGAGTAAAAAAVTKPQRRSAHHSTPPPPPARPAANSWQKGSIGSALPAPAGNVQTPTRVPPEPPARQSTKAPHQRVPPGPPARRTTSSMQPTTGRQQPPPPPSRGGATTAPVASSGPRVIPPPPPRR